MDDPYPRLFRYHHQYRSPAIFYVSGFPRARYIAKAAVEVIRSFGFEMMQEAKSR